MGPSRLGRSHQLVNYNSARVNNEYWKVCGAKGGKAGVDSYIEYDGNNRYLGRLIKERSDEGMHKFALVVNWLDMKRRHEKRKR